MRSWLVDALVGGAVGLAVAGVAAVNLVIYSGIEGGYEATFSEVFTQNPLVGVAVTVMLVLGPVLGVHYVRSKRHARRP